MDYWFGVYQSIKDKGVLAHIETKEKLTNKAIDFSVANDTKYPTVKAVKDFVDSNIDEIQEMMNDHKNDYIPHKLQDLENSRELLYGFEIDANGVLNFVLKEIE